MKKVLIMALAGVVLGCGSGGSSGDEDTGGVVDAVEDTGFEQVGEDAGSEVLQPVDAEVAEGEVDVEADNGPDLAPNTNPEAWFVQPEDGALFNLGDEIILEAEVLDDYDEPEELAVVLESSLDGVLMEGKANDTGRVVVTVDGLTAGQHEITLTVTDSGGLQGGAVVSVIINTPPIAPEIHLEPENPTTLDDIILHIDQQATDPDGGDVEQTIEWFKNGVKQEAYIGETLSHTFTAKGQLWGVVVKSFDGHAWGAVAQDKVTVVNSPPAIQSVSVGQQGATVQSELTCVADGWSDADGDGESYEYVWAVNGEPVEGAVGPVLPAGLAVKGAKATCTVTPFDGEAAGEPVTSAALVIDNSAPSGAMAALSPKEGDVTTIFECSAEGAVDPDGDLVGYGIEWIANDQVLPDASSSTFDGALQAKGDTLFCRVVPNDGEKSGLPADSNVVTLANAPPVLTEVDLLPMPATVESELTCLPVDGMDPDPEDEVSYGFAWFINGEIAQGLTTSTLAPGLLVKGDQVQCRAAPFDGAATGPEVLSEILTIANSLPTLDSVVLSPLEGTENTEFTCTPQGWKDGDDDLYEVRFEWYVNDLLVPEAQTGAVDGEWFDSGDLVFCVAIPQNGDEEGVALESETATVVNSPPVLGSVSIVPPAAPVTVVLECIATGLADADPADIPWMEYNWYVDGVIVESETAPAFDAALAGKNTEVTCGVTPLDSAGPGGQVMSAPATVVNTLPLIQSLKLEPGQGSVYDTYECIPGGWLDADGDPPEYEFVWTIDGQEIPGATAGEFWSEALEPGNWIGCTATPVDDDGAGATMGAPPAVVVNNPPSLTGVELSPIPATAVSTLTCTPSGWSDAEGDPEQYEIVWTRNGIKLEVAQSTLGPAHFQHGDTIVCQVTPKDPWDTGAAVASPALVIDNTPPTLESVSLVPGAGTELTVFQCLAQGYEDVDLDEAQNIFEWLVNGEPVPDAEEPTLNGAFFSKGDEIACRVTASDGQMSGNTLTSGVSPVANTPPTVGESWLAPSFGTHATEFFCQHSEPMDPDDDGVVPEFQWYVNGEVVPEATQASFKSNQLTPGDKVNCTVTPFDGAEKGKSVSSDAVTLGNELPGISTATLSPVDADTATALLCTAGGVADPDGDEVQLEYVWRVNGEVLPDQSEATLEPDQFIKHQEVMCEIHTFDGFESGGLAVSDKVTIVNTPPTAPQVVLSPGDPTTDDDLVCFVQNHSEDLDGDDVDYVFAWFRNDELQEGLSENVLSSALTDHCDVWRCRVTPTDNDGPGEAAEQFDFIAGAAEWCDGKDNDCNDEVDDGLGTSTCGLGPCEHTIDNCQGGLAQQCDPLEGSTDEVCDGADNNCNGETDEALGTTTCGLGPCEHTTDNCVDGTPLECDPLEGAVDEICDGADNDCDGVPDNDMGSTTCGLGECHHTVENCVDSQPQICDPFEGKIAEVCDGLDNDCDGEFDNGFFKESLPCPYFDAVTWRTPITIAGSSAGPLTAFQVKVSLDWVNSMRTDFNDVRFGDSEKQQLTFWKESFTSSDSAVFWVKIPQIPGGPAGATIYAYWGDPNGADKSDIHNTFLFGDDFEDPTWTAANWSHLKGTWTVSGGILYGSGDDAVTRTSAVIGENNRVVEARMKTPSGGVEPWDMGWLHAKYKDESNDLYGLIYQGGAGYMSGDVGIAVEVGGGFTSHDTMNGPHPFFSAGLWHDFTVVVHGSNAKLFIDGDKYIDANDGGFAALTGSFAGLAAHDSTSEFDNFRVRKSASPEPGVTVGSPEGVCSSCL